MIDVKDLIKVLKKNKINFYAGYMQNSGLGNSLNPIISIAHKRPSFLEVSIKVNLADNNLPRPKNLNQVLKKFSDK